MGNHREEEVEGDALPPHVQPPTLQLVHLAVPHWPLAHYDARREEGICIVGLGCTGARQLLPDHARGDGVVARQGEGIQRGPVQHPVGHPALDEIWRQRTVHPGQRKHPCCRHLLRPARVKQPVAVCSFQLRGPVPLVCREHPHVLETVLQGQLLGASVVDAAIQQLLVVLLALAAEEVGRAVIQHKDGCALRRRLLLLRCCCTPRRLLRGFLLLERAPCHQAIIVCHPLQGEPPHAPMHRCF